MAEIKMKNFIVEIGDKKYKMIGSRLEDICEELGISEDRFIEILSRDAYCPTLSAAPTSSTLTYVDTDGNTNHFRVGQLCRWAEGSGYRLAVCKNATETSVAWYILPTKVSELTNDAGYLTSHQDISHLATKTELSGKVDKVSGKQLSTEDFTTALKNKLNGLSNYDDTTISNAVYSLQTQLNTLVSGNPSTAINSFNEIIAFLEGITDSEDLESIIASIEQQIAAKQDKVLKFTNKTASSWVSDSTYADYPYRCDIACSGVTDNMYAEVNFSMEQAISGKYAPICETKTDIVSIWSNTNESITVPNIVITK